MLELLIVALLVIVFFAFMSTLSKGGGGEPDTRGADDDATSSTFSTRPQTRSRPQSRLEQAIADALEIGIEFQCMDSEWQNEWMEDAELEAEYRLKHPTFIALWDNSIAKWGVCIPGRHVIKSSKDDTPNIVDVDVRKLDGVIVPLRVATLLEFNIEDDNGNRKYLTVGAIVERPKPPKSEAQIEQEKRNIAISGDPYDDTPNNDPRVCRAPYCFLPPGRNKSGLCIGHRKNERERQPFSRVFPHRGEADKQCEVPNCTAKLRSRNVCDRHNREWRKQGYITPVKAQRQAR